MKERWLLFDATYLCWRSFHAMGNLRHDGIGTGMAFGFLREVLNVTQTHATRKVAFAFDVGRPKRCELFPGYKGSRKQRRERSEEERESYREVQKQMTELRTNILPTIGFRNVWWADGYEADDLIAQAVNDMPRSCHSVIVGSDSDMYQMLSPRCSIWSLRGGGAPKTIEWFHAEYGLEPLAWADVKAIAGGHDDIVGIVGVGEKTAAKFLCGKLKPGKKFDAITLGNDKWEANKRLTALPFEGTPSFEIEPDKVTAKSWDAEMNRLGMSSLLRGW